MSFLGLGSFGEGFVKGFAESANDALKRVYPSAFGNDQSPITAKYPMPTRV